MASLSSITKETPEERINRISPEPKGIIEGYQQVFNGVDDYMKKVYQSIGIDLSTLLEKCAKVADQYNEPEVFETNPYTFTPPQTLIEFYIAKYIRNQLNKERWNLLFKKFINGVVHDIRLVEKKVAQGNENISKRKQKLRTIVVDLFAELWLYPLFNSGHISRKEIDLPVIITLDELVAKIKAKMEVSGVAPEDYFIILPVLTISDGEGIDLEELANRLGIPRKNIVVLPIYSLNKSTELKSTEELSSFISFLQSLEILFEMED
jgi:hypothetical protein